jgi:transcriptional adapter 2-alpha
MNLDIFNLHVADGHVDRSVGVKKPRYSADEGPSLTELSGYNAKRHEFDPEYDNDAEQALAEMEFKETDSETDRELKLRVLRIYLSRFVRSETIFLFIATLLD